MGALLLDRRVLPKRGALTLSAGVITDAVRLAGVEGDGGDIGDGVGLWPAATNKITQSIPGALATTGVTKAGDAAATLDKVADSTHPFADATADVWCLDNSAGSTDATVEFDGTASAAAHAASIYAYKTAGSPTLSIEGAAATTISGATWAQYQSTATASLGDNLRVTAPAGAVVYFVAAQLETGGIATTFILTDGGTASRVLGRYYTDINPRMNGVQGWIAIRMNFSAYGAYAPIISLQNDTDASSDNRMVIDAGGASGRFRAERKNTTTTATASMGVGDAVIVGDDVLIVARWSAAAVGVAKGGGTWVNTAATNTFAYNSHRLDTRIRWSPTAGSYVRHYWMAAGDGAFPDADLARLDAFGNNRPLPHQIPTNLDVHTLAHFNGDGTAYRWAA